MMPEVSKFMDKDNAEGGNQEKIKLNQGERIDVNLSDLIVWSDNPRTPQTSSEKDAINTLFVEVTPKKMMELLKDIIERGLQANEIAVVVKENDKYVVYDGNRRIAALKSYFHPELITNETTRKMIEDYKISILPYDEPIITVLVTTKDVALELAFRKHGPQQSGESLQRWNPWQRDKALSKNGLQPIYPKAFKAVEILNLKTASELKTKYSVEYTDFERILSNESLSSFLSGFDDNLKSDAYEKVLEKLSAIKTNQKKPISRIFDTNDKTETFTKTIKIELAENKGNISTLNPSGDLEKPSDKGSVKSLSRKGSVQSHSIYTEDLISQTYKNAKIDIGLHPNSVFYEMLSVKRNDIKKFPISFTGLIRTSLETSVNTFLQRIKHPEKDEKKFPIRIHHSFSALTYQDFEGLTHDEFQELKSFFMTKIFPYEADKKTGKAIPQTGEFLKKLHAVVHQGSSTLNIYDFKKGLNDYIIPFIIAMSNYISTKKL